MCLGKTAVQLKLKDVPQARQGSCTLLAVCNTTSAGGLKLEQVVSSNDGHVGTCHLLALEFHPAYARYSIWMLCSKLQLDWECSISGNKAATCLRCSTNLQGRAGQGRAGQGAKHAYTDEARQFEYSRLASIWLVFIC